MLTISRVATIRAGTKTGFDLANRLHSAVNKAMDLEVSLFAGGPGHPGGTFIFSAVVENMAQAQSEEAKMLGSEEFLALSEEAAELAAGPTENKVRSILALAPEAVPEIPIGATLSSVTAEIASGQLADAMGFGVELVSYYNSQTDLPVAFLRNISGGIGEVQWLGLCEDSAALDRALNFEATDAGYQERFASAGGLFTQGSGHRTFATRIA